MSKKDGLKRLLKPRSVAVIGGRAATETVRQCQRIGFDGDIWPVNPRREEMAGVRCYPSVADLPGVPDAAFIGVPREAAVEVARALADLGTDGAVCYTSGFAEAGGAGVELQTRLLEAAGDMAIVGPNCHGAINYLDGVALWPDEHGGKRVEKGVAIVLQSGNVGISLTMQNRSLPIAYVITIGNKADLSFHDYIEALCEDPRVTAIGLYVESLTDVDAFSAAALTALRAGLPIVAMKTGTSALGAAAALSHTSSLAGSDDMYNAMFARLGIARVHSLGEFVETLKFVSAGGALAGTRIGSLSCSGGEASMVADLAERTGLDMPALSQESAATLYDVLGDRVHIANPLDYDVHIWGNREAMCACFSAMLGNAYDCTLLVIDYPRPEDCSLANWEIAEQALTDACAATGQRAVIVSTLPENFPGVARDRLLAAGIAPMQGLVECLAAIRAAAVIGSAQRRAGEIRALPPVAAVAAGRTLDEWESKRALAAHGLKTPEGRLCAAHEAAAAAAALGFPVAVKATSAELLHKTEAGGVALNLNSADEVAQAVAQMQKLSGRFLVEKMAPEPVAELIVGIKRDPTFGLGLVIGAGGILVELVQDSALLLLPAARGEIEAALLSLKAAKLLSGFRGRPAGDVPAAIDAIEAIARYAEANRDALLELDVNPLLVLPEGQGAVAVDALIRSA